MRVVVIHGHRDPGRVLISRECVRRVDRAQRIDADLVIFSGAGLPGEPSEAGQMHACWRGSDILCFLDEDSTSTVENAARARDLILGLKDLQVHVVTSWWHAPRAWLVWRGRPGYRLHLRPSRGSVRYLPAELVALARIARASVTRRGNPFPVEPPEKGLA